MIKKIKELLFVPWVFLHFFFAENHFLENATYAKLNHVSKKNRIAFYKLKKLIENKNIKNINKKEKIKIGFVLYTGSMWNVDGLYKQLKKDKYFDTKIIVAKFAQNDTLSAQITYETTLEFFNEKGYEVNTNVSETEIKSYDVLMFTTPYGFQDDSINLLNIKLKTLVCYVSYSYMLANNEDKFDLPMYYLSWIYFCDTEFYLEEIKKKSKLFTDNLVYCGYSKMDEMYVQKTGIKRGEKKTIVYAPHHSVTYNTLKSSTFDENYKQMLEVAKKYEGKVEWIVKPHPLLADKCVNKGIFKDYNEYNLYWNEWKSISGTEYVADREYFDAFKRSDAMITDSVSFLVEYQFTHNPLLLLMSGKFEYNAFGEEVIKRLYKCQGTDTEGVERFINSLLDEKDDMKHERELFFKNNIDYFAKNGVSANDLMYDVLIKLLKQISKES